MLERLADLIRVLLTWRADPANPGKSPRGATGDGGFRATPEMMSILGCSAGELGNVLKALGFWAERRKLVPVASAQPAPETPSAVTAPPAANGSHVVSADDATQVLAGEEPHIVVEGAASVPEAAHPAADAASPIAETAGPVVEVADPIAVAAATTGPETASVTVAADASATAVEPVAEQWEEVWRPRRKGRTFEAGPERHKQPGQRPRHAHRGQGFRAQEPRANKPEPQPVLQQGNPNEGQPQQSKPEPAKERQGKERHRRPNGRRGGPNERQERTRVPLHASPPKQKAAAFDPDSPFAALSSLKAALEKRSQD